MHFISLSHAQTESSSNDESAENDMVCMIYMYVQLLLHVMTMATLIACAFYKPFFQSTIHINPMCVLIMATVMLSVFNVPFPIAQTASLDYEESAENDVIDQV